MYDKRSVKLMQTSTVDNSRRGRRRGCHGNEHLQQRQLGGGRRRRPVVVLREPRLELSHPDDFHALRHVDDDDDQCASTALPLLVCPRHRGPSSAVDEPPPAPATSTPLTCVGSCCEALYSDDEDTLVVDDVIPLPVHYVAAQHDDDSDDDFDEYDVNDDDSGCSDSGRHASST